MPVKQRFDRLLNFLLGDKRLPYQYSHHAVLLVGGFGYLACSIFNYVFQTSDIVLAYAQLVIFFVVIGLWYRSRFHGEFRWMAIGFMFLLLLVSLPLNWVYNSGLSGPTYFLYMTVLAYINVAFRDFGYFRLVGSALAFITPLFLVLIDLYYPELIYQYPDDAVRALDLSFSFIVTIILLMIMMGVYSKRYQLERDKAEHLAEQLRILSEQDPLTGLHNRRAMDRYLESLNHSGTVFSLAILDLDHFKKLNDRHGHSYGDEVLCLYAKQLNRVALACKGLAVRLGGEEFVLLMPMEEEAANELISELASRLKQLPLEHGEVTFSGGLAQRIDGESRDHLLARADQLLYAAKDAGRNRIYASQAYAGEQAELVLTESES